VELPQGLVSARRCIHLCIRTPTIVGAPRAGSRRREDPGSLKCSSFDRFTIDFLSILPVHYIQLIVDGIRGGDGESSSYTRALKILRLLRLAKLLRIARLKKLLEKYEDAFDASQYMGLMLTLFIILFMAHIMAW
jgi:hypothetical protein